MIKTITLTAFAILSGFASMVSLAQTANNEIGYAYVHTSRNSPTLVADNKKGVLSVGSLLSTKNLEIECNENQTAFLILSNRTVLQLAKNTKIKINSFLQTPPFSFDFYDENEKTRSELDIELLQGQIRVLATRPRATSSIKVSTRFGKFDVKSMMFSMSVSEDNAEIIVFEGQSTFTSNSGKSDFIQNKQRGSISAKKLNSRYPMKIEYLTSIEEDALVAKFDNCKTVFNSVLFSESKDGKVSATRITPKEFLNRSAKYEYRK